MTQIRRAATPDARRSRAVALSGLLVIQAVCALFFLADVTADLVGFDVLTEGLAHNTLEVTAVGALILGILLTTLEIRRIRTRQRRVEAQLKVASGAFLELLDEHFDGWGLTPSEREVALLSIKGLSIAEIAEVRQTKEGTVKAQSNAIYSKAGVSGRPQLLSLFIEELISDELVPPRGASAPSAERASHTA
jgi:DNA-binding CsgD family transcriptional regulator